MAIIRSGQLTQAETVLYNATIMYGLEFALKLLTDVVADKIALVRPIVIEGSASDPMSKKIPTKSMFPFSSGTPLVVEDLTDKDRPFSNLVETTVTVDIKPYGAGYYIKRTDFFNDLFYVLRQIPRKLVRAIMKLPDVHLAKLLRNGCKDADYTGKPYFAVDKFGKRGNLAKKMPLNRKNLIAGCVDMLSRQTPEGIASEVPPDTLIVPPTLFAVASKALGMRKFVDSSGATAVKRKKRDKSMPLTMIKQVIVMPELLGAGSTEADQTTWYLASCMSAEHGGPHGLLVAIDSGFEYLTNLAPSDPEVFYRNRFAFGAERYAGFAYGNSLFMSRFEAEGDTAPVAAVPEPAPVPTTAPTASAAPTATPESKIRFSTTPDKTVTDARIVEQAKEIAKHLGCNVEDILKHTTSAAQLPNSDGHTVLKDRAVEASPPTGVPPVAPTAAPASPSAPARKDLTSPHCTHSLPR